MCQIFAGPSNKIRDALLNKPGLLENLMKRNKDGLGAMYATSKNLLRTPKIVPQDLAAAKAFIRQLPDDDRNLVIHFRMKTSGKIDHDNAHPFPVIENEVAMTHNGILSYPTKSDETMCDTRHYIRDIVRPQLELCPALMFSQAWLWLVGAEIGSNRFVLMNRHGEMAFVNKHTGYEFDGMWFANKYSFDAALLDESFAPPPPKHWSHQGYGTTLYPAYGGSSTVNGKKGYYAGGKFIEYDSPEDMERELELMAKYPNLSKRPSTGGNVIALPGTKSPVLDSASKLVSETTSGDDEQLDDIELDQLRDFLWQNIANSDADELGKALQLAPKTVVDMLFDGGTYTPLAPLAGENYSQLDERITKCLVDQDADELCLLMARSPAGAVIRNVAEVIAWFGTWERHDSVTGGMTLASIVEAGEKEIADAVTEAKGSIVDDMHDLLGQAHAIIKDMEDLDMEEDTIAETRAALQAELNSVAARAAALDPDSRLKVLAEQMDTDRIVDIPDDIDFDNEDISMVTRDLVASMSH